MPSTGTSNTAGGALLVERDGHVVTWTINRPALRNPISEPDVIEELEAAVAAVNADPTVHCAILTGRGTEFSSGGNVKHMRDRVGMSGGSPAELRRGYRHGIQRIPRALYHCEIPVLAAVNGPAIGVGCDLALMCDIRLASASATAAFAESFVKVGIVPGDGLAWPLPQAIGASRAAQMVYTGAATDAGTALQWGLVSEVIEPEVLLDAAHVLARQIAANSPQIVRMTKRLLREGQHKTLESHLELSAAMQTIAHHTADHYEAVDALLDKRTPKFGGS